MSSGGVRRSAYQRVLDRVGAAIVSGELEAGSVISVDALVDLTGASRSIVREATRVLASVGLLTARPKVGLRIADRRDWDALDSDIVRWRLDSPQRSEQIAELLDLRLAIEPAAAQSAARRRTDDQAAELIAAGEQLRAAASLRDGAAFFDADARFHGLVTTASENRMFARLQSVLREALRERTPREPFTWDDAPADVDLHVALADAIDQRDPDGARDLMSLIVRGDRAHAQR